MVDKYSSVNAAAPFVYNAAREIGSNNCLAHQGDSGWTGLSPGVTQLTFPSGNVTSIQWGYDEVYFGSPGYVSWMDHFWRPFAKATVPARFTRRKPDVAPVPHRPYRRVPDELAGVRPRPDPTTDTDWGLDLTPTRVVVRNTVRPYRPPKGVWERKASLGYYRVWTALRALWRAADAANELNEIAEALVVAAGGPKGMTPRANFHWLFVDGNITRLSGSEIIEAIVLNEIKDAIIGRTVGRLGNRRKAPWGGFASSTSLDFGPAL